MSALLNSSLTSPRAGDRSHRQNRNPRDLTGKAYHRLHAENDARKAAASLDINEVREAAWEAGFSTGYDAGVQAVIRQLQKAGVIDADDAADETGE